MLTRLKSIIPSALKYGLIVAVAVVFAFTVKTIWANWTAPREVPPNCTTDPTSPLYHPGCLAPINVSGNLQTKGSSTTVTTPYLFRLLNNADDFLRFERNLATNPTTFRLGTDNALVINNSNIDTMTLKGGNVGIRETNPDAKLHIGNNMGSGDIDSFSEYQILLYDAGSPASSYGIGIQPWTMVFNSASDYKFFRDGTNVDLAIINGNVGIGTTSPDPAAKLEVAGQIKITGGSPGANKFLSSDAAGLASWQTITGTLPSGTSGETLRHDGTNWVANSLLFNNGTNVGIRTTEPQNTLDVNSAGGAWAGYRLSDGSNMIGLLARDSNVGGGALVLRESTGATDKVKITNSGDSYFMGGDVGIGITDPGAKLEVAGQIKITGGSPGANKVLTSDAGGLASWQAQVSGLPAGSSGQTLRHDGTSWVANSLLFNNGTNVGIGSFSVFSPPDFKLDVKSDVPAPKSYVAQIRNTNRDDGGGLRIFIDNSNINGKAFDVYTLESMVFKHRFIIRNDGKVGINLENPAYTLDIGGALRLQPVASAPAGANGVMYYDSGTNKFRCYQNGAWSDCVGGAGGLTNAFTQVRNSGNVTQFTASGADYLQFAAGTGLSVAFDSVNRRTTFTNTGDTNAADDITTITGTAPISVTGAGNTRNVALAGGCSPGQILEWNGTSWACAADDTGGGGVGLWTQSVTNIHPNDLSWNVGIGITNPPERLTVSNTDDVGIFAYVNNTRASARLFLARGTEDKDKAMVYFGKNGSYLWHAGLPYNCGAVTTGFVISRSDYTHNCSASRDPEFIITAGGNVGIGTTNPGTTLDVAGSGQFRASGSPGLEIRSIDGGTPYIDFSNGAGDYDMRLILTGDDSLVISGGNLEINPAGTTSNFWVASSGIAGQVKIGTSGGYIRVADHLVPDGNRAQDLGASGNYWRDFYSEDGSFSNTLQEQGSRVCTRLHPENCPVCL